MGTSSWTENSVISSQIALHTLYGGVVPEIASRKHIEKINQVIASLKFKLEEESAITLSAQMSWGNGGSCIAYDHFTLTQLPEGSLDPNAPSIEGGTEDQVSSPTEGVISHEFVEESAMQQDLLQMLANSLTYAHNIWYDCAAPNSKGETCGYFKANSAGQSNEDGVRTNADFSMICAFLCK